MPDQFKFDSKFQDLILASFIRHPNEFLKFGQILKASYFEGVHSTAVAYAVLHHIETKSKSPSWEVLRQISKDRSAKLGLDADDSVVDYVEKLREFDTSDHEYVATRVVEFARERATVFAIKKSVELLQEGKIPEDGFVSLFEQAVKIGQDLSDLGILLHRDAEDVVDKVTDVKYGTKTGFAAWDRLWYHGWGPGWLVVLLAPPKRYKTAMCINLAMNMVSPAYGYDVLYYPCEITQELAALRTFQRLTGSNLTEIYQSPNQF
jgi:replicative DNA helicase